MREMIKIAWLPLGLSIALLGCGKTQNAEVSMNTGNDISANVGTAIEATEDANASDSVELDAYGMQDELGVITGSVREQLDLIAAKRSVWFSEDSFSSYGYTVTDLDHNGRLEIIASTIEGTGMYSYTQVYEVNTDLTDLELCTIPWEEGESQPDIMIASVPTYYDGDDNTYLYIFEDTTKADAVDYYGSMHALSLQNGEFVDTVLATKEIHYEEIGAEPTVTCKDYYSRSISEEEYNSIYQSEYEDLQAVQCNIIWLYGMEEQIAGMDDESLASTLLSSYGGFAGEIPH